MDIISFFQINEDLKEIQRINSQIIYKRSFLGNGTHGLSQSFLDDCFQYFQFQDCSPPVLSVILSGLICLYPVF